MFSSNVINNGSYVSFFKLLTNLDCCPSSSPNKLKLIIEFYAFYAILNTILKYIYILILQIIIGLTEWCLNCSKIWQT